jgi:hypothetical protein
MHPTQKPAPCPPRLAGQLGIAEVDVTPAQTLRGAALYVQRHGWTQHHYYWRTPGKLPAACALGAIGMAAHGQALDNPQDITLPAWLAFHGAYETLNDYLELGGHYTVLDEDLFDQSSIGNWNDHTDQTAEQVIAALHAAADHWDNHHRTQDGGGGR